MPPTTRKIKPISLPDDFLLKKCIAQPREIIENTPIASLVFGKPYHMSLGAYKQLSTQFDHPELTLDQKEAMLWSDITKNTLKPIYAMNNEVTRFPDEGCAWNMSDFKNGTVLIGNRMPGINSPYVIYGMYGTCFGMHVEDSFMASININHEGADKTWYGFPSTEAQKIESLYKSEIAESSGCDLFIRHKSLMIPPQVLKDHGINFGKVISILAFCTIFLNI